jgi:Dullard-like phosphatase family protein
MKSNIKKLFQKTIDIESIFNESEKEISTSKNESASREPSHLVEFRKQLSNICIFPLNIRENYTGNYSNYIETGLTHISQLQHIKFEYALEDPKIMEGVPNLPLSNKKILLLDLDETLMHADFDEEYIDDKSNKYDTIIKFKANKQENEESDNNVDIEDSTWCSNTGDDDDDIHSVGIFIRNNAITFLNEVSKYFDVGIFTASVKEYADAVISFLDPENKLIKFRLYRNNCINFNNSFYVKDLRIFKNVDLRNIVLLDNSIYSFAAQINNGILINSFFNNKNDEELNNAFEYLINYILPSDDVKKVNEEFFNFGQIINDLINCK